jgi:hypothetical protein
LEAATIASQLDSRRDLDKHARCRARRKGNRKRRRLLCAPSSSPSSPRHSVKSEVPLAHGVEAGQERERTGTRSPLLHSSSPYSPPRADQKRPRRCGCCGPLPHRGSQRSLQDAVGVGVTAASVAFGDVILQFLLPYKGYLSLQVGTLAGGSLTHAIFKGK